MSLQINLRATMPHHHGSQTLSRQEAKSRLQKLIPGTEEHSKLQNALIRTAGIVEICLPSHSYRIDTSSDTCALIGGFGGPEHIAIGAAVELKGLKDGKNTPLLVKDGTPILFKHIVALGGDYYAIPNAAISLPGGSPAGKEQRFINAFNTLRYGNDKQAAEIVKALDAEHLELKDAALPHECYSCNMLKNHAHIKKIKDDIDEILYDNSDHFSENAVEAYKIGHNYAMKQAQKAGQKKNEEDLKIAYALDAFACHFLTDLFAAGHNRNQRGALEKFLLKDLGFGSGLAKKFAGLLTFAQHEIDGKEGLHVKDKTESWMAYGDGLFNQPKNGKNKSKVEEATQRSADEIHDAYENPGAAIQSKMEELIPEVYDPKLFSFYKIENLNGKNRLFLYADAGTKTEITTKFQFWRDAIPHAGKSKYITQDYMTSMAIGFADTNIITPVTPYVNPVIQPLVKYSNPALALVKLPQVVSKAALGEHPIERITGIFWGLLGVASFEQAHMQHDEMQRGIIEAAGHSRATYVLSEKIFQQVTAIGKTVEKIHTNQELKPVTDAINKIRCVQESIVQGVPLITASEDLHASYATLSTYFVRGIWPNNKTPLQIYSENLPVGEPLKISTTLWFREILDYQVQALLLYGKLSIKNEKVEDFKTLASQLEKTIQEQIAANKDYIDEPWLYETPASMIHQITKIQAIQNAAKRFQQFQEKERGGKNE